MSTDEVDKAVRANDPASGMTIRERFAMAAMQGLLASDDRAYAIRDAVRHTDALLAAMQGVLSNEKTWVAIMPRIAEASVQAADALLAALEGRHDGE